MPASARDNCRIQCALGKPELASNISAGGVPDTHPRGLCASPPLIPGVHLSVGSGARVWRGAEGTAPNQGGIWGSAHPCGDLLETGTRHHYGTDRGDLHSQNLLPPPQTSLSREFSTLPPERGHADAGPAGLLAGLCPRTGSPGSRCLKGRLRGTGSLTRLVLPGFRVRGRPAGPRPSEGVRRDRVPRTRGRARPGLGIPQEDAPRPSGQGPPRRDGPPGRPLDPGSAPCSPPPDAGARPRSSTAAGSAR